MRDEPAAKDVAQAFQVSPGARMRLDERDPADKAGLPHKAAAKERTEEDAAAIDALQDRLYAERRRALLVILQGTDTSGKDGTIRAVFNRTGPLGVSVTAFGRPSPEELAHDFLWRVHAACPRRGTIGIFNRSHYEDVLVARVRGLAPPDAIEARYGRINDFERLLTENGTTILKFMLHISREEQGERLRARLEEPASRWKFNPDDLEDRKLWDEYRRAYEIMLERCSTAHAPWHVIPGDRKWVRNAVIAKIVRATLEELNPEYPDPGWRPDQFEIE
jgi:PPK2 family polyphosphate:nucleotide phosphotransferase